MRNTYFIGSMKYIQNGEGTHEDELQKIPPIDQDVI